MFKNKICLFNYDGENVLKNSIVNTPTPLKIPEVREHGEKKQKHV